MRATANRSRLAAVLSTSLCSLVLAAPSVAAGIDFQAPPAPDTPAAPMSASDLPPGCGDHWKDPNVRVRNVGYDTYIHEMSNSCVPYGPVDGTVPQNSTFRLLPRSVITA
jgi:hypothetical protein